MIPFLLLSLSYADPSAKELQYRLALLEAQTAKERIILECAGNKDCMSLWGGSYDAAIKYNRAKLCDIRSNNGNEYPIETEKDFHPFGGLLINSLLSIYPQDFLYRGYYIKTIGYMVGIDKDGFAVFIWIEGPESSTPEDLPSDGDLMIIKSMEGDNIDYIYQGYDDTYWNRGSVNVPKEHQNDWCYYSGGEDFWRELE